MTREEARRIIAIWLVSSKGEKGQRGYIEGWFDEEDAEAFRIAIEALKCELSEDGTLEVKVEDATKIGRVLISDDKHRGGLYYPDEYEPQSVSFENDAEIKSCSKDSDLISRADAIRVVEKNSYRMAGLTEVKLKIEMEALPLAEAVSQSEQYKKGFEDAKRAFLVEYARESENMRKRNAQLEVRLNAQKAISADRPRGRWHYSDGKPATIGRSFGVICDQCGAESEYCTNFCGECGADMRGEEE